jgi:hypothetical protein
MRTITSFPIILMARGENDKQASIQAYSLKKRMKKLKNEMVRNKMKDKEKNEMELI